MKEHRGLNRWYTLKLIIMGLLTGAAMDSFHLPLGSFLNTCLSFVVWISFIYFDAKDIERCGGNRFLPEDPKDPAA